MTAILTKPDGEIVTVEPMNREFFSSEELKDYLECDRLEFLEPAFATEKEYLLIGDAESEKKDLDLNSFATHFYGVEYDSLYGNIIICPIEMTL